MAEPENSENSRIEVQFTVDHDTKNTVKFKEYEVIGQDLRIGYLYVRKTAYQELGSPERLIVTLEAGDTEPFPRGVPKE